MRKRTGTLVAMVALVGAGLVAACDKVPLLAPSNSTIVLSAGTKVLAVGGTTSLSAFVAEASGTPVQNGTTVRFTTTLGRVDPAETQTLNGIATATFVAGPDSGVADVKAVSGGAAGGSSAATTANVVQITVGAAAVSTVTVRANPGTVAPNGGTVEVVATVLGDGGRALAAVPVTFSADTGTLSVVSVTSDTSGEARASLTTDRKAIVTAAAGAKTGTVTVDVRSGPLVTLTCAVGAGACTPLVGQTVTFTAAKATGSSTLRTTVLDFGDGTSLDLGALTASTAVTHAYRSAGAYVAVLRGTDTASEIGSASVPVQVRDVVTVSLTLADNGSHNVTATANVNGAGSAVVKSYEWVFTEGATATTLTTTGSSASFTFGSAGLKTVKVTVTLSDDRTAVASGQLSVN